MIRILEEAANSLTLQWEPHSGSPLGRYSYGDTGWRIYASLLAGVAGGYDLCGMDSGVSIVVPMGSKGASFGIFGDWSEVSDEPNKYTSYWKADSHGTVLAPSHREAIDDAAYFATSNQLVSNATIVRRRASMLRALRKTGANLAEFNPDPDDILVRITPSVMGDEFVVTFAGSPVEIQQSKSYMDDSITDISRLIV